MASFSWPASRQTVLDLNGNLVPGALLNFYVAGTSTPLVAYSDSALTTPLDNIIPADSNGRWPRVYLPYTDYRERVRTANGVLLWDDDGIANPAPASSGGGDTVPDSELLKTGSWKWLPYDVEEPEWVRANARTIGNAGSGATERANADTEALYILLWDRLPNTVCPVSTGRGATGAADYAAGKTLGLPDLRGCSPFGLDTMGNTAAARLVSVTFDVGSATAAGSYGGRNTSTIAQTNLPAIAPTGSVTGSINNITALTAIGSTSVAAGGGSAAAGPVTSSIPVSFSSPLTFVGDALGSGTALSTMPRFMLGSHFLKL